VGFLSILYKYFYTEVCIKWLKKIQKMRWEFQDCDVFIHSFQNYVHRNVREVTFENEQQWSL